MRLARALGLSAVAGRSIPKKLRHPSRPAHLTRKLENTQNFRMTLAHTTTAHHCPLPPDHSCGGFVRAGNDDECVCMTETLAFGH